MSIRTVHHPVVVNIFVNRGSINILSIFRYFLILLGSQSHFLLQLVIFFNFYRKLSGSDLFRLVHQVLVCITSYSLCILIFFIGAYYRLSIFDFRRATRFVIEKLNFLTYNFSRYVRDKVLVSFHFALIDLDTLHEPLSSQGHIIFEEPFLKLVLNLNTEKQEDKNSTDYQYCEDYSIFSNPLSILHFISFYFILNYISH